MKPVIFTLLILFSGPVMAGGDFVLGKILDIKVVNKGHLLEFKQEKGEHSLIKGCGVISVFVKYQRVPEYSWLPFIKSSHPTKDKHDEAIDYLKNAHKQNLEVYFGYMGGGLIPSEETCSFNSKGLALENVQGKKVVLSFNEQV